MFHDPIGWSPPIAALARAARLAALVLVAGPAVAQVQTLTDGQIWLPLAGQSNYAEVWLERLETTGTAPLYQPGLPSGPVVALAAIFGETYGGLGGGTLYIDGADLQGQTTLLASTGYCPGSSHLFDFMGPVAMGASLAVVGANCRSTGGDFQVTAESRRSFEQLAPTLWLDNATFLNTGSYRLGHGATIESRGSYLDDPGASDAPLPAFMNRGRFTAAGDGRVRRLDNQPGGWVEASLGRLEIVDGRHTGGVFFTEGTGTLLLSGAHQVGAGSPLMLAGQTVVGVGGELWVRAGGALEVSGTTQVQGLLQVEGSLSVPTGHLRVERDGVVHMVSQDLTNSGTIEVLGDFVGQGQVLGGELRVGPQGAWRGAGLRSLAGHVVVDGLMELRALVDPLRREELALEQAVLAGSGRIFADVSVVGVGTADADFACGAGLVACIEPGDGLGTLVVDGFVDFRSGGALRLEVGRVDGSLQWDQLQAGGLQFLSGSALRVEVEPGSQDGLAHRLWLATCPQGCSFDAALLVLQGPGQLGMDTGGLWLDLPAAAVPEPAAGLLMLAGVVVLLGRRRGLGR